MQSPFRLPFPSRGLSPHAETATQQSAAWVEQIGLLDSFPETERYKILFIGDLVARTHVTFELEALQLIADWSMWLFINDDLFDHLPLDVLESRIQRYLAILNGETPTTQDAAFVHGLADLWRRTLPSVSEAWKDRFIGHLGDHLRSSLWEAQMKLTGQTPDVATYLTMRQVTSGIDAYVDLLDISPSFDLPAAVQYSPPVQRLMSMVNNITSWANEVLSVDKEMAQGDHMLNMVWLYHHHENVPLAKAMAQVVDLCQSEIDMFEAQKNRLPRYSPEVDQELDHYASLLQDIVRGTLDWHFVTDRYRQHWGAAEKAMAQH